MTDASGDLLPLAAAFPAATRAQWLVLVEAVLKGAPFDRKLVSRTADGIAIEPLYARSAQSRPLAARAPGIPWQILQRIDHPEPAAANAEALHDLENGADGLSLVMAGSNGAHGYGLAASEEAIARALAGVRLDAAPLELDLGPRAEETVRLVAALARRGGVPASAAQIRFGLDPLGAMAMTGTAPMRFADAAPRFARLVAGLADAGFKGPFAVADGRIVHDAGGSEAQELAFVLAVATAYLRALESCSVGLEAARTMICFRLTADADQLLTMAKFRALRKLWARVEAACGLAPQPSFVSAETAWRTMTRRDPYANMLRSTIAVLAAGLAGADAVTALPFTLARGLPDRFARRMARNTQLVLLAEANLASVADPAAGSGAIETLTDQLCGVAWRLFREIENAGGAAAALEQGLIQKNVAAVRAARAAALARRTDMLTGTTDFPDLDEADAPVLEVAPLAATLAAAAIACDPLPPMRLAEPFDALRDASDRILAASGARPSIFLANLGTPADFMPRATFALNFFGAGGIAALDNNGFRRGDGTTDLVALSAAFKASGAKLACLCASDEVYARDGIAAAKALAGAGATHIYLAGRPRELETALAAAGVGTFVYAGCDALAVLRAAHKQL